jgi:hypothetical protein
MNVLAPLSPGKWNEQTAAQLLNRAGFGGTPSEIEATRQKGLAAAVRDLVDFSDEAANVPAPSWAHPRNVRPRKNKAGISKRRCARPA